MHRFVVSSLGPRLSSQVCLWPRCGTPSAASKPGTFSATPRGSHAKPSSTPRIVVSSLGPRCGTPSAASKPGTFSATPRGSHAKPSSTPRIAVSSLGPRLSSQICLWPRCGTPSAASKPGTFSATPRGSHAKPSSTHRWFPNSRPSPSCPIMTWASLRDVALRIKAWNFFSGTLGKPCQAFFRASLFPRSALAYHPRYVSGLAAVRLALHQNLELFQRHPGEAMPSLLPRHASLFPRSALAYHPRYVSGLAAVRLALHQNLELFQRHPREAMPSLLPRIAGSLTFYPPQAAQL